MPIFFFIQFFHPGMYDKKHSMAKHLNKTSKYFQLITSAFVKKSNKKIALIVETN